MRNLLTVSRYITEIAPSARRGMLVSMPQFMACAGICAGYFTCYGSVRIESSLSWRGQSFSILWCFVPNLRNQRHTSSKPYSGFSWLQCHSSCLNHRAGSCCMVIVTRPSKHSNASTLVRSRPRRTCLVLLQSNRWLYDNQAPSRDLPCSSASRIVSLLCSHSTSWE